MHCRADEFLVERVVYDFFASAARWVTFSSYCQHSASEEFVGNDSYAPRVHFGSVHNRKGGAFWRSEIKRIDVKIFATNLYNFYWKICNLICLRKKWTVLSVTGLIHRSVVKNCNNSKSPILKNVKYEQLLRQLLCSDKIYQTHVCSVTYF